MLELWESGARPRSSGNGSRRGFPVAKRPLPPGVDVVCGGGRIAVRPGLGSRQKTLGRLHELVHAVAHDRVAREEKPVRVREREAEATTFVVGAVLGLDAVGARDYLLTYRIEPAQLRGALATIQRLTRRVLEIVAEPAAVEVERAA